MYSPFMVVSNPRMTNFHYVLLNGKLEVPEYAPVKPPYGTIMMYRWNQHVQVYKKKVGLKEGHWVRGKTKHLNRIKTHILIEGISL